MAGMRDRVRMDPAEQREFLAQPLKMALGTVGPDGSPHLVTMYYAMVDDRVAFWTYRTSQKAKNLARDPRCSILVEEGDGYDQLRGVSIRGKVEELTDVDDVLEVGVAVSRRYFDFDVTTDVVLAGLRDQATKRSAYLLTADHVATWDHRKLAQGYG